MPITLRKNDSFEITQKKLSELQEKRQEKVRQRKREVLKTIEGTIPFDASKTALEIQQEMRNDWE